MTKDRDCRVYEFYLNFVSANHSTARGKQSRSVFVDDENNNLGWGTF